MKGPDVLSKFLLAEIIPSAAMDMHFDVWPVPKSLNSITFFMNNENVLRIYFLIFFPLLNEKEHFLLQIKLGWYNASC